MQLSGQVSWRRRACTRPTASLSRHTDDTTEGLSSSGRRSASRHRGGNRMLYGGRRQVMMAANLPFADVKQLDFVSPQEDGQCAVRLNRTVTRIIVQRGPATPASCNSQALFAKWQTAERGVSECRPSNTRASTFPFQPLVRAGVVLRALAGLPVGPA